METRVRLLGQPTITSEGVDVTPSPGKVAAVLYYLAYLGEWVRREDLLYLCWPDAPEARARSNLRQLLRTLRRLPYTGDLRIEPTHLHWKVDSDLRAFRDALEQDQVGLAAQRYGGPLLHGFHLRGAPEFESWLVFEREELHQRWRHATLLSARDLHSGGRAPEAVDLLERVLSLEPLDEEVTREHMHALHAAYGPGEALASFERFRRDLARDLGVEPEPQTVAFAATIQRRAIPSLPAPQDEPRLPRPLTPFVGRAREISLICEKLGSGDCRLLTILGVGGMGKSRLALEVARRLEERFMDGVVFLPLVHARAAEAVPSALADALSITLVPRRNAFEQIATFLDGKRVLLVFDNLEHLRGVGALVLRLLESASGVSILATSREALDVRGESLHDLQGLTVPPQNGDPAGYDAVTLLLNAARRADGGFALTASNTPSVVRLCRLTGGMPLALELAATWLRVLPIEEVASELEASLDLLHAAEGGGEARHRSVRVALDGSWARLTHAERAALRALSTFRGGFTRDAAREVANLGLPLLLALRNRSFLTLEASGRFGQHPLVAHYVLERAEEEPISVEAARSRHAEYFAHFLRSCAEVVGRLDEREPLREVGVEIDNACAAWRWAVAHERWGLAEGMLAVLDRFHFARGLHQEQLDLVEEAARSAPPASPFASRLTESRVGHLVWVKRYREAIALGEGAVETLRRLHPRGLANVLNLLGIALAHEGETQRAREHWCDSLVVARAHGEVTHEGRALMNLAITTTDAEEGGSLARASIALARRIGDPGELVWRLRNHALHLVHTNGRYEEAAAGAGEAIEVAREGLERNDLLADVLLTLARVQRAWGRLDAADASADEASMLLKVLPVLPTEELRRELTHHRAHLLLLRGKPEEALTLAEPALVGSADFDDLLLLARLALEVRRVERAEVFLTRARDLTPIGSRDRLRGAIAADLLVGEVAPGQNTARARLRRALVRACEHAFVPLALEGVVVASAFVEPERAEALLMVAAHHPASAHETRVRAVARLGGFAPREDMVLEEPSAVLEFVATVAGQVG